jgi:hypothetical protein
MWSWGKFCVGRWRVDWRMEKNAMAFRRMRFVVHVRRLEKCKLSTKFVSEYLMEVCSGRLKDWHYNLPLILLQWRVNWIRLALYTGPHCTGHSNAVSPWHCDSYREKFNLIQTVQLLSATGPTEHCAVSIQPADGHPPQTDQRSADRTDRKCSPEFPQLKSHQHYFYVSCSSIACGTVQLCDLLMGQVLYKLSTPLFNVMFRMLAAGHSNYFYLYCGVRSGLDLCLSNSHTVFLLMQHCRSLNVTVEG